MRGDQDLDVLGRGDVLDELQDLLAAVRVQVGRRLVEEEELGIVDEGLGQLEPLLHPGRIRVEEPVPGLAEPDVEQDLVGPLHGLLTGHARQLAEIGGEGNGVHARR